MMDGRVFIWEVVSGARVDGSEGIWGQWWTDHMGTIVVMSIEFVVALWHFLRRIGMVENGGQAWVFFFLFCWRNGFGGYLFFLVMTCVFLLQRGYPFLLRWTILWWEGEIVFCAGFWSGLVWSGLAGNLVSASVHNMYGHMDHFRGAFFSWILGLGFYRNSLAIFFFLYLFMVDWVFFSLGGIKMGRGLQWENVIHKRLMGDRQGGKIVRWIE